MLKEGANSMSYSRGLELYRSNRVDRFTVEEVDEYDYIEARVKGSGRNYYKVYVDYDIEANDIEDITCECPAFSSYHGICKHCVAVLLEYIDYRNRKDEMEKFDRKQEEAIGILHSMKGMQNISLGRNQNKQLTTPIMKQLLTNQITRRTLQVAQNPSYGNVWIEPILLCDASRLQIEFKVGTTQMYVLKDVFSFVQAIEQCKDVSYGKKLEFIHTMEAFDPKCRPLVLFIRDWVGRKKVNMYRIIIIVIRQQDCEAFP